MFVGSWHQSEWFVWELTSTLGFTGVLFQDIIIEHEQSYSGKCMSCSGHYIIIVEQLYRCHKAPHSGYLSPKGIASIKGAKTVYIGASNQNALFWE